MKQTEFRILVFQHWGKQTLFSKADIHLPFPLYLSAHHYGYCSLLLQLARQVGVYIWSHVSMLKFVHPSPCFSKPGR